MSYVHEILKKHAKNVFTSSIYISPEIPEKKLNNAIMAYGKSIPVESVVLLYDGTLFGNAKVGMLFSGTKLIWKDDFVDPKEIEYEQIDHAEYIREEKEVEQKDGSIKIKILKYTNITLKDGTVIKVSGVVSFNYENFANLINEIKSEDIEYFESNPILTINDMSSELKIAYMKILINMTFSDDDKVDEQEYLELMSLMSRLDFNAEERIILRVYINQSENYESTKHLMDIIVSYTPKGNEKAVRFSLIKDIINISKNTGKDADRRYPFIYQNNDIFQAEEDEIQIAEEAIETDKKIISGELSSEEVEKNMKELKLKAAAIGVPLAAVYMSGSVMGLGVYGVLFGLSNLAGIFGFSGLLPGVGVAMLLGLGTYTGLKALTGGSQTEAQRKREIFLQGIVKNMQKTTNMLIEDINYITHELISALEQKNIQEAQIDKLKRMLTLFASTGKALNDKTTGMDSEIQKNRCPQQLDITKLKNLTIEPTKAKYYQMVVDCYEKTVVEKSDDVKIIVYQLKEDLSNQEYENLAHFMDAIGYGSVQGNVKNITNTAKGFFKGLIE